MITFGPVPSRRLGRSLGINNIISPKACSFDCVYCQVGKTIRKINKREVFYRPEIVCEEVEGHLRKLNKDNYPDYLTFVSNGEPTLDAGLGKAIGLIKQFGIPVAVITNASLLSDLTVREDLSHADLVSLKIDAGDNDTWDLLNRPYSGLSFAGHIENIILFAGEYRGLLLTETMVVDGINDSAENFTGLAEIVGKVNPQKAYLSVPTRPPAVASVKVPSPEKLNQAWQLFHKLNIITEFLTGFEGTDTGYTGNIYNDILNITTVHPLREDALFKLLQRDNADIQVVTSLVTQRLIKPVIYEGNKYYLREYHYNV